MKKIAHKGRLLAATGIAFALGTALPTLANAAKSGGGLPWEGPLQKLVDSITGPVAFAVSLLALVAGGIGLAMGGDMNEFMRRMIILAMVIAVIVFAANIMQSMFSIGAVIPMPVLPVA